MQVVNTVIFFCAGDSGEIEYNNLTPGKYTVRVVARATERGRRRVVRRSFLIGMMNNTF